MARPVRILAFLLASAVFSGAGGMAALTAAAAERPSETQIIDALKAKPATRGLTRGMTRSIGVVSPPADERRFINSLRRKTTRAITIEERVKVAEIAKAKPSIDLEINFEYNSAVISGAAMPTAVTLGRAITNGEFKGAVFMIAGHTDAKGSDGYNQDLSERRAAAVRQFLIQRFQLPSESLIAVGFGQQKLKVPSDPFAADNRRVQIVNMTAQ
jgi:outer membrane protein OmpA-like peptidoglycan-associated protein